MKKIIENGSVTVDKYDVDGLGEKVNEKIKEGFQPYGFPCVAAATDHNLLKFILVQAMVKYEK
jgi:hypothetical protein